MTVVGKGQRGPGMGHQKGAEYGKKMRIWAKGAANLGGDQEEWAGHCGQERGATTGAAARNSTGVGWQESQLAEDLEDPDGGEQKSVDPR